jgi:hypothetical protein
MACYGESSTLGLIFRKVGTFKNYLTELSFISHIYRSQLLPQKFDPVASKFRVYNILADTGILREPIIPSYPFCILPHIYKLINVKITSKMALWF